MEKRGIIEPGRTPPEEQTGGNKTASDRLEDHVTKRLNDAVVAKLSRPDDPAAKAAQ